MNNNHIQNKLNNLILKINKTITNVLFNKGISEK